MPGPSGSMLALAPAHAVKGSAEASLLMASAAKRRSSSGACSPFSRARASSSPDSLPAARRAVPLAAWAATAAELPLYGKAVALYIIVAHNSILQVIDHVISGFPMGMFVASLGINRC
ncbi:hypothetical protein [Paenibacillus sanguinis]|uniref:hypothetical protein n=1 Tax=Paenibacillus sanguinis TaxID=225906 RepID=UPI00146D1AC4|nr:hypothetical protein [Paenibacillus sanguinis]